MMEVDLSKLEDPQKSLLKPFDRNKNNKLERSEIANAKRCGSNDVIQALKNLGVDEVKLSGRERAAENLRKGGLIGFINNSFMFRKLDDYSDKVGDFFGGDQNSIFGKGISSVLKVGTRMFILGAIGLLTGNPILAAVGVLGGGLLGIAKLSEKESEDNTGGGNGGEGRGGDRVGSKIQIAAPSGQS